jgi:large subunit ribosomal protein L33
MREMITLACSNCKRRNYHGTRDKRKKPEKVEAKKYCKWCRKHTLHKETK